MLVSSCKDFKQLPWLHHRSSWATALLACTRARCGNRDALPALRRPPQTHNNNNNLFKRKHLDQLRDLSVPHVNNNKKETKLEPSRILQRRLSSTNHLHHQPRSTSCSSIVSSFNIHNNNNTTARRRRFLLHHPRSLCNKQRSLISCHPPGLQPRRVAVAIPTQTLNKYRK